MKFFQQIIKKSIKKIFTTKIPISEKGFSLIEILIALTLLGIAGTFVAGKFFEQLVQGQIDSTKIQMNELKSRLKEFRRKCGAYPTTDQGLEALVSKPSGGRECKNYPPEGFIDGEVPNDPWDEPFNYESDGRKIEIWSYGPDNAEGGEDNDADIYLNAKKKSNADD